MISLRARCILLDIEGTVSDVRFVYDVMFPYARREIPSFLARQWSDPDVQAAMETVAIDAGHASLESWLGCHGGAGEDSVVSKIADHLEELMARDSKTTGLKSLQGLVWKSGFESGAMQAELFDDVLPALKRWKSEGLDLRIYSSGSILAQRLFFQHTTFGDIAELFSAHYDTTIGPKKDSSSYARIAIDSQYDPRDILFVTDSLAEIQAAEQSGMQTVASLRPNNAPLPADFAGLAVTDFSQLNISRF